MLRLMMPDPVSSVQHRESPGIGERIVGLTLKQRVACEFSILAVLSTSFIVLFPRRPIIVDLGLGLLALGLVLLTAKHTRSVIWGRLPVESAAPSWKRCLGSTLIPTALAMGLFLLVGAIIAYQAAGWPAVGYRIVHPRIPTAVALYFPWALLQQTLFLFYLLGRVRVLLPALPPLGHSALKRPRLWPGPCPQSLDRVARVAWGYCVERLVSSLSSPLAPCALPRSPGHDVLLLGVRAGLAGTWMNVLTRWG